MIKLLKNYEKIEKKNVWFVIKLKKHKTTIY